MQRTELVTRIRDAMLPGNIERQIVDRIRAVASPVKVILFGSYAYGEPSAASDVDIAVIERSDTPRAAESARIWRALSDIPYPKDILVASEEEFEFYRHEAGSVFRTIDERGVVLYAE